MMFRSSLMLLSVLALASCGGKSGSKHNGATPNVEASTPDTSTPTPTVPVQIVSSLPGVYEMTITKVNARYSGFAGTGSMVLGETDLTISMKMNHVSPLRSIYQRVYSGECPTIADDKNGDGVIDIKEAQEKLGKMLIPLDTDINSSNDTKNVFPQSSVTGKYSYTGKGMNDLILKDLTANGYTDNLDLESVVILFQGLPSFFRFSNSVESSDGLPVSETLPVACATIKKSTK